MDCSTFSYDLHVLGTPPALILSQDQTLVCNLSSCRRVEGRLAIAGLESRDGATVQLLRFPKETLKTTVVYLVRSLGLGPSLISHDWHVQPSCQRPNRLPPKRREFSPGEPARVRIRLSSKPYNHTVRRKTLSTSAPHKISRCFPHRECLQEAAIRGARPELDSRWKSGPSGPRPAFQFPRGL